MCSTRELEWIFETCDASGISLCAAFRACGYLRGVSRRGGVADKCNRLFFADRPRGSYHFPVRPIIVQCLFTAVKIETREWNKTAFRKIAVKHIRCLQQASKQSQLKLHEIEFEIAEALEWRLAPFSPFLALSESAASPRQRVRASDVLRSAIITEVSGVCGVGNADLLAAASLAAAEVLDAEGGDGSDAEALRCVRAMVACVEYETQHCLKLVRELSEQMEKAHRARCAKASPLLAKRKRTESVDSPSSVVPEAAEDAGATGN